MKFCAKLLKLQKPFNRLRRKQICSDAAAGKLDYISVSKTKQLRKGHSNSGSNEESSREELRAFLFCEQNHLFKDLSTNAENQITRTLNDPLEEKRARREIYEKL